MRIKIKTIDNKIWNEYKVFVDIAYAMTLNEPITIDLLNEGVDLRTVKFYDKLFEVASTFQYPISNITVITANALESHDTLKIKYLWPVNLVLAVKEYKNDTIIKISNLKHFGIFVNRSSAERLHLASYLHKNYLSKLTISYNFNIKDDYHKIHCGLDNLILNHGVQDTITESNFLNQCPIRLDNKEPVLIDNDIARYYQLLDQDRATFIENYKNFFVEIVCESYYTGKTFFPTEKTWRPIMLKTPFIVQGPQWFLHRLRDMGFQTFDRWWDEGYAEDTANHQLHEIKKVIDFLAEKSLTELDIMYQEMQPTLEHNRKRFMELTSEDFDIFKNDRY